RMDVVPLVHRTVLFDVGDDVTHAYFPHSGIICLMAMMQTDGPAEIGTVGREGFIGFGGLLCDAASNWRALVQAEGLASRVEIGRLRHAVLKKPRLRELLFRYLRAYMAQTGQAVACNGYHSVRQRLCRWLLTAHDRAGQDTFELTHAVLAEMLAVRRRATLTETACALQAGGIIEYKHGVVTIKNRRRLEASACECYGIVRRTFDEILMA
ncbi:MAG: Crp/Fnr family transcriptional regulator, partial [Stellaceae bacterium]